MWIFLSNKKHKILETLLFPFAMFSQTVKILSEGMFSHVLAHIQGTFNTVNKFYKYFAKVNIVLKLELDYL